jgi:hypothetical protein
MNWGSMTEKERIIHNEVFMRVSKRLNDYLFSQHHNTIWHDEELTLGNGLCEDIEEYIKQEQKYDIELNNDDSKNMKPVKCKFCERNAIYFESPLFNPDEMCLCTRCYKRVKKQLSEIKV